MKASQPATILLTVDNQLDALYVNNNPVDLTGISGLLDWTQVSTINLSLAPGDTVTFKCENTGGPEGLLAQINYTDNHGKSQSVVTGQAGWTCDGGSVIDEGANGVGPWGNMASISPSAHWIWNPSMAWTVNCSFTIPTCPTTSSALTAAIQ